jgi:RNA polymerase sigma-70 factor (ECF subfamily)
MDEKVLIARARQGDYDAFMSLVDAHRNRLFGLARRMTGNTEDAKDIVQETLLKAIDKIDQFRGEGSFGTWLYAIALNEGRAHLAHSRRFDAKSIDDMLAEKVHGEMGKSMTEWNDPHTILEQTELERAIGQAIGELPSDHAVPFSLRYMDEMSIKEIALLLGLTEAATKSRIMRARLVLRDKLDPLFKSEVRNG